MKFNFKYKSLNVDIALENHVNVLTYSSGSGKTFLLSLLYSNARNRGMNVLYVDYTAINYIDSLLKNVSSFDIVLMDNADLYMNLRLCNELNSAHIPSVMCLHNLNKVNTRDCSVYRVCFDNSRIYLKDIYHG